MLASFFLSLSVALLALGVSLASLAERSRLVNASEAVLPLQMERVQSAVRSAGETYHFSPESVLPLVTEDSLRAANTEAVDTLIAMAEGTLGEGVYFTLPGLEEAIRNDPQFIEETPAMLRDNVARDEASAAIEKELQRAVLPVRLSLAEVAEALLGERLTELRSILSQAGKLIPLCLIIAAVCIAVLLLQRLLKRLDTARLLVWLGASCGAAFLLCLCSALLIWSLRLPGRIAELSPILSGEVKALFQSGLRTALLRFGWLLPVSVLCIASGRFLSRKEGRV
ncbi:MAG: hypothetical protein IKP40_14220 [Clostridia bacterium]|nr:hypothetical protein [Clostridia bacterium]